MKLLLLKSVVIIVVITIYLTDFAYCFDDTKTHPEITSKSVETSNLNSYLINSLDFPEGTAENIKESNVLFPEDKPIIEWIKKGSTDEDHPACRASNHFHNPLKTWDLSYNTDAPNYISRWCHDVPPVWPLFSNITWATGYTSLDEASYSTRDRQNMGWDNARTYFYQALTSTSRNDRNDNFIKTFRAVGQVMHLLEDMAVPAHVRNDFQSHLIFQGVSLDINFLNFWANPFEYYVKTSRGLIASVTVSDSDKPSLTNIRVTDFWDTTDTSGSTSSGAGLAEITNRSFFSNQTIPDNNTSLSDKYYSVHTFPQPQLTSGKYDCEDTLPGATVKTRYVNRVPCPTPEGSGKVDHLVAYSFMTSEAEIKAIEKNPKQRKYIIDNNVHNTYATDLLPKAIGYSAALLDYFFRGTIDVQQVSGNDVNQIIKVKATNTTTNGDSMSLGDVALVIRYSESQNNDNLFTLPVYTDNNDYHYRMVPLSGQTDIPRGQGKEFAFDLSANPLPSWANYVTAQLVYRGQLGNEANAVAVGPVVLKVFPKDIEISRPASGVYAATTGPDGFSSITLSAKANLPGFTLSDGTVQLVLIHRTAISDPFQGTPVTTSPANEKSFHVIRADASNGVTSLSQGISTELTFDISATPLPLWASDVHIYVVYKRLNAPDSNALAVGYVDVSEPTPVDAYNNTNKVCLNGNWYNSGSPEAMAIADTNHNGYADLDDIFPHRISNIYFKAGISTASSSNYTLAGSRPLEPGQGMRLGYILTDYEFSYNLTEQVSTLDNRDDWDFFYTDGSNAGTGFINQGGYGKYVGYGVPYSMPGYQMWWGAGVIYDNDEYPTGSTCSWSLLP